MGALRVIELKPGDRVSETVGGRRVFGVVVKVHPAPRGLSRAFQEVEYRVALGDVRRARQHWLRVQRTMYFPVVSQPFLDPEAERSEAKREVGS